MYQQRQTNQQRQKNQQRQAKRQSLANHESTQVLWEALVKASSKKLMETLIDAKVKNEM